MDSSKSLFSAIKVGNSEKVRSIIDSGCDIEIRDNHGCKPLFLASSYGNLEIVKYLIFFRG